MYIDTHCHLTFKQYHDDLPTVIGNAKRANVKQFIVPGVDDLSNRLAVELAQRYPGVVFAAVGFHPYEASHTPDVSVLERFLRYSIDETRNPIIAIGECGLDYHLYKGERAEGKKQVQRILFEEHLRLALQHNLPLTMHCREAFDDFFTVLDSLPAMPRGVIHCFSGGLQDLRMALSRGLFIGVDGNITYSSHLQTVIPHIPLAHLLLETDAPYLTPAPHRGSRNEPKYIPLIAKTVARLHGVTPQEVQKHTTANARRLFVL